MNLEPVLYFPKNQLRYKTITLLEENIENLYDFGFGDEVFFLIYSLKINLWKKKMNNLNLIRIRNFLFKKDSVREWKDKPWTGKIYLYF